MLGMQMEERNKHKGINTHSYAYSSTEKLTCTLVHRYIQSHTHTHNSLAYSQTSTYLSSYDYAGTNTHTVIS